MKKLFLLLTCSLFLTNCDPAPVGTGVTIRSNRDPDYYSVKDISKPEKICEFSDGRMLYRIEIGMDRNHSHFVYFFNNSKELSINYPVPQGKTTRNEVIVQLPE